MPQRFDVTFTTAEGKEEQAVMIHRTVLGSMERFFACLIEQYAGAFPAWLAPVQATIIPIADRHVPYAVEVVDALRKAGIRATMDDRPERMNMKIREAQLQKVPYILVAGDREAQNKTVALRLRTNEDLGAQPVDQVIARIKGAADNKSAAL
jgi:threonyl-tRNA synthetase